MHQIVCFERTHTLGRDLAPLVEPEGSARPSHKELWVWTPQASQPTSTVRVLVSLRPITSPSGRARVLQPGFFFFLPFFSSLLPLNESLLWCFIELIIFALELLLLMLRKKKKKSGFCIVFKEKKKTEWNWCYFLVARLSIKTHSLFSLERNDSRNVPTVRATKRLCLLMPKKNTYWNKHTVLWLHFKHILMSAASLYTQFTSK